MLRGSHAAKAQLEIVEEPTREAKAEARKVQPWREVLDGHVPGIFAMKPASEALQGYGQTKVTKEVVIKQLTRWEEDIPESLGRRVESPTRTLNFEAWSTAETII